MSILPFAYEIHQCGLIGRDPAQPRRKSGAGTIDHP